MQITVTVNGVAQTRDVEPRMLLVHFLRDELGLTGTHWSCDTSNCGACVVQYDGQPVKSCTVFAAMAQGHEVRTVEGLASERRARPRSAGVQRLPRPAVRVLHLRDDAHRPRPARREPGPVAIERTGEFNGRYHVLGGALSPIEGIRPEQLRLRELVARVDDEGIKEVVAATNPNVAGDATALYLARLLKPLGVMVTQLASGLPVGGDLDYADEITLGRALAGRREL